MITKRLMNARSAMARVAYFSTATQKADVLIVGGGIAGTSLAAALS